MVCGKCGGWFQQESEDGWTCILCGHIVYRVVPMDIPAGHKKNPAHHQKQKLLIS